MKDQYVRLRGQQELLGRGAPRSTDPLSHLHQPGDEAADLRSGSIQYADVAPAQYQSFVDKGTWTAHKSTDDSLRTWASTATRWARRRATRCSEDWRFRNALNWAIDRREIANIAYNGAAIPATSFLPSGYGKAPLDYHWEPPVGEAYTYDPVKAGQLLDAAGYKEVNGVRLDHNGKPIKLRLWAVTRRTSTSWPPS